MALDIIIGWAPACRYPPHRGLAAVDEPPHTFYTGDMDWWSFHEVGNPTCDACAVEPVSCPCGEGLIHTQFDEELEAVEGRCDQCQQDVPALVEV